MPLHRYTIESSLSEPYIDTLAAIQVVLHCRASRTGPSFVLRHQLYCIVSDPAEVDRSVEEMKRGGLVRTLSVPFYPNDVIIALEESYRRDIREYYDGLLSTGADRADVEAARGTILQLLESGSRDSVLESEIQDAYSRTCAQPMAGDTDGAPIVYARKRSRGDGREERGGALLRSRLNAFLLPRRDVDCESMFYLTHPQMGLFIKWVENTRQELTRALRRCSNNECPETRFVAGTGRRGGAGGDKSKLKLRTSPLGWRYHLYDAVGSERVERYSVGGGAPSRSMAPRADGLASFIRLPR